MRLACISASASARVASGPMVMGFTTMPLSNALDLPHLLGLLGRLEVAVDHAHAAGLRHGDRHAAFGDGVHRRATGSAG